MSTQVFYRRVTSDAAEINGMVYYDESSEPPGTPS